MPGVTIKSDSTSGHTEITLDKTGSDKGTIRVKTWASGHNPATTAPTKNDLTELYNVKAGDGGSRIVCLGRAFGPDPTVTCALSKPPLTPTVHVTIKGSLAGIGDGTTDYAIAQADLDALKQFIASAGFPPLP